MYTMPSLSVVFLLSASFKILGGFMKWGVRNKIAEKKA